MQRANCKPTHEEPMKRFAGNTSHLVHYMYVEPHHKNYTVRNGFTNTTHYCKN